jgi:metal-responsive CopG/Arc/MetJ family transcriptional regulator
MNVPRVKNFELLVVRVAGSLVRKMDETRGSGSRSLFIRSAIASDLRSKKFQVKNSEIDSPDDKRRLSKLPEISKSSSVTGDEAPIFERIVVRVPTSLAEKIDSARRETRSQYVRNAIAAEVRKQRGDVSDIETMGPDRKGKGGPKPKVRG